MRPTITCSACGTVLGVPKGGVPAEGLSCNWCGYVTLPTADPPPKPVAAAARSAEVATVEDRSTPAPKAKAAPHRWADDDDDNGQAYDLPAEEVKTRKCEECGKEIEVRAVVCVHCGYDGRTKSKTERTFDPIDKEWEAGWPFERRMTVFVACQAINAVTLVLSLVAGRSLGISIGGILFYVALQAFLLGTYNSVRIRRNKRGQAEITVMWRVGFVPMAPKKVDWRSHEGVAFGHYDPTSLIDWWIFFMLLPFFIIPAIVWFWLVIRSERFFAALARDRGYPETYLYRGMNEKQAKEISQVATDATGLPLTTPL